MSRQALLFSRPLLHPKIDVSATGGRERCSATRLEREGVTTDGPTPVFRSVLEAALVGLPAAVLLTGFVAQAPTHCDFCDSRHSLHDLRA